MLARLESLGVNSEQFLAELRKDVLALDWQG